MTKCRDSVKQFNLSSLKSFHPRSELFKHWRLKLLSSMGKNTILNCSRGVVLIQHSSQTTLTTTMLRCCDKHLCMKVAGCDSSSMKDLVHECSCGLTGCSVCPLSDTKWDGSVWSVSRLSLYCPRSLRPFESVSSLVHTAIVLWIRVYFYIIGLKTGMKLQGNCGLQSTDCKKH